MLGGKDLKFTYLPGERRNTGKHPSIPAL
jgi:hypothetical protein